MNEIEISSTNFERRETTVYYSSPKILVQRKDPFLEVENEKKESTVLRNLYIPELSDVKAAKYREDVLLICGGKETLIIQPDGKYEKFDINNKNIVTQLYVDEDKLIFGSLLGRFFHFVIYDLKQRKRLFQTQSLRATTLSYKYDQENIYALMGNSQLVCYDHEGKEKWRRFEHQHIIPGIAVYKNRLLYCSNNQIKITDGKTTDSVNVPLVRLNKIEGIIGDSVYAICEKGRNICCFDIIKQQLKYEIKGEKKKVIRQLLLTKGKYPDKKEIVNVLFFSNDTHLALLDIKKGSLKFYLNIPGIKNMIRNDELIISTHRNETRLLRVKKNEKSVIEI